MDNFNNQNLQGTIKKFPVAKIIFIVLGLVLLGEVIYAAKVLTSPVSAPLSTVQPVIKSSAAKIYLSTNKTTFAVGETVPVVVLLDSGGKILDGADLIVNFNPKILEATTGGLMKGKIFDEYPLMAVDSNKGVVSISGISSLGNSFKGSGQLAIINFKAKAAGASSLVIDFKKGSTSDTNMVETGTSKDILETADNLNLTVQ